MIEITTSNSINVKPLRFVAGRATAFVGNFL
jgi:hypothetical protein